MDTSPLAATAGRLNALDGDLTYRVGPPLEPGWCRLTDLVDATAVAAWHRELTASHGDRRAAAAFLGGWVADAAVDVWALPVWADRRLPLVAPHAILVRRHAKGWIDAVGVDGAPAVAVLADDPAAGQTGTVVASTYHVLVEGLSERLATLEPLLRVLASVLPVGLPALWGGLADSLANRALWLARRLLRDRQAAWQDAARLIDRLAADRPPPRPRPFPVHCAQAGELFAVRGTCCLHYRTVADPDRDGDGYCTTCPLRTDASRRQRLRAYLQEETPRDRGSCTAPVAH
ncbi:MAG: (2Fe-2S)-binding protein [Egibacteraceae bacterium]